MLHFLVVAYSLWSLGLITRTVLTAWRKTAQSCVVMEECDSCADVSAAVVFRSAVLQHSDLSLSLLSPPLSHSLMSHPLHHSCLSSLLPSPTLSCLTLCTTAVSPLPLSHGFFLMLSHPLHQWINKWCIPLSALRASLQTNPPLAFIHIFS